MSDSEQHPPAVLRNPPPPYRLVLLRVFLAVSLYLCLSSMELLDSVGNGGLFILLMGMYIATGGGHTLYLMWHTLGRDARGAFRYLRLLSLMYYYQRLDLTVPRMFKRTVQAHPRRKALLYQDVSWTFTDLDEYSNRVANYFLQQGYKRGDCVALQMHNRPVTKLISKMLNTRH